MAKHTHWHKRGNLGGNFREKSRCYTSCRSTKWFVTFISSSDITEYHIQTVSTPVTSLTITFKQSGPQWHHWPSQSNSQDPSDIIEHHIHLAPQWHHWTSHSNSQHPGNIIEHHTQTLSTPVTSLNITLKHSVPQWHHWTSYSNSQYPGDITEQYIQSAPCRHHTT
jgi:hypothetical protein